MGESMFRYIGFCIVGGLEPSTRKAHTHTVRLSYESVVVPYLQTDAQTAHEWSTREIQPNDERTKSLIFSTKNPTVAISLSLALR